jgi:predicted RNase H-like HicB family nuclease
MTHYTYPISIEKEDGQYFAHSEALPGVHGLGDSLEEARTNMLEGIRLYILQCMKDGKAVPTARTIYSETVSVAVD